MIVVSYPSLRRALACGGAVILSTLAVAPAAFAEEKKDADVDDKPDAKNKQKPELESKDLDEKGKKLFLAIQKDDPDLAKHFFFPREPFLVLKDMGSPGKYWDHLYKVYEKDIHELHKKHAKSLEDAEFDSIELGSKPGWVKPGEESNKIGYFRTFNAKLRYKAGEKKKTIEIKVIISWQGKWTITHLLPFKKK